MSYFCNHGNILLIFLHNFVKPCVLSETRFQSEFPSNNPNKWHHIGLSFKKTTLDVFYDGQVMETGKTFLLDLL